MASFMLHHRHLPGECPSAYAAWKGFDSFFRGQQVPTSCRLGGHEIWWQVDATDETDALSRLPRFVRERTEAIRVNMTDIP